MKSSQPSIFRKLTGFIGVLRDADIPVSPSETTDLFKALDFIPLSRRSSFRQALKTTLIKDSTDIPLFEKCFDNYFHSSSQFFVAGKEEDPEGKKPEPDNSFLLEELALDLISELSGVEDISLLLERVRDSILSGEGSLSSGALSASAADIIREMAQILNKSFPASDEGRDEKEVFLRGLLNDAAGRGGAGMKVREREKYLLDRYIYRLTKEEIEETEDILRRLGQKLKNRISLRKKRVKRGGLDIKRTLRQSTGTGGLPFRIYHRDRKIMKPRLAALCDVSGSVNIYSRFMLLLTSILQNMFSRVRTFAFISSMVEITGLFRETTPEKAINSIFTDEEFTYGWGSNYGKSFREFLENYSDSLTARTTVLILGDARNNNQDPGLRYLQEIGERCREIIWLNPEKMSLWDWGDSIVSLYKPFCREMREVNNLNDLSDFINNLFFGSH